MRERRSSDSRCFRSASVRTMATVGRPVRTLTSSRRKTSGVTTSYHRTMTNRVGHSRLLFMRRSRSTPPSSRGDALSVYQNTNVIGTLKRSNASESRSFKRSTAAPGSTENPVRAQNASRTCSHCAAGCGSDEDYQPSVLPTDSAEDPDGGSPPLKLTRFRGGVQPPSSGPIPKGTLHALGPGGLG